LQLLFFVHSLKLSQLKAVMNAPLKYIWLRSQEPATGPYTGLHGSSLHPHPISLGRTSILFPIYAEIYQTVSYIQVSD